MRRGVDETCEATRTLASVRNGINRIEYGPTDSLIATSDVRMQIRVLSDGYPVLDRDFGIDDDRVRPTQRVRGLGFSQDGGTFFVAAADTLQAINLATGQRAWSYVPPRSFGFLIISPLAMALNGAGDVAAAFDNGSIGVWDESGLLKCLWHHNDAPRTLGFAADKKTIIGTDSFCLTGWNWETRKRMFRMPMRERVYGMGLSRAFPVVALRTLHSIQILEIESRKVIGNVPIGFGLPLVAMHPSAQLLCYGERNAVVLTDFDGKIVDRKDLDGTVLSLAFSPDGSEVAIGCDDTEIRFWSWNL